MDENKVVIFGCGDVGKKVKEKLEKEGMNIVAFTDNNEVKWDTFFCGIKVISPKILINIEFDYVAIGVYKAVETIKTQLLEYGILEDRILLPIKPNNRIFVNPKSYTNEELVLLPEKEYFSIATKEYQKLHINILDKVFLYKLEKLKEILFDNNIPRKNVCIVSGAVLQVYGLRESKKFDDIDIIMTSDLRELYGKDLVIVSEYVEMHPQNEYRISDDDIILDISNHFVFSDLKFMSLKLLYENKKNKINSLDEVKIIEKYWDKK